MRSKALPSAFALALVAALGYAPYARAACDTGNPLSPENDCDNDGFTLQQGDCNDSITPCAPGSCDPTNGPYVFACVCGQRAGWLVNPGRAEVCDGLDNNCNTQIDEGLVQDSDNDGVRACGTCRAPASPSCDCDDTRSAVKPGATEICDAIDNNCNGGVDEGGGPGGKLQRSCYPGPAGTQGVGPCVAGNETCNATTPGVASWFGCNAVVPSNPPAQAESVCNSIDDDCDGVTDDGLITDADGDGSRACSTCGASSPPNCDCNDGNSSIKPGLVEACNGVDDNCNGSTDEGIAAVICFTGPAGTFTGACPGPTCAPRGQCRTGTATCSGGSVGSCSGQTLPVAEICNGLDDDCDGVNDDGLIVDADGDGSRACGSCGASAAPNCDCNDGNSAIRPGAAEVCDNVDNNCNGSTDESLSRRCFDGPAGTFTGTCPGSSCTPRGTCVFGNQTCSAGAWGACNGQTLPAAEICNDCLDTDCNGQLFNGFTDADGDGNPACSPTECNDNSAQQRGAFCSVGARAETCDTLDNNCNGSTDEGLGGADADGDGFLACGTCGAPAAPNCDCNDGNAAIKPGATEICDCIDQNCNGSISDVPGWTDADGDGVPTCAGAIECNDSLTNGNRQHGAWCSIGAIAETCDALDNNCNSLTDERDGAGNKLRRSCYDGPGGTAGVGLCVSGLQDCNASSPPNASWGACTGQVLPTSEACDNQDNNCNGTRDEGFDADGDGYKSCTACPSASPCDCNDSDASIRPGAVELCDNVDQNCDGQVNDVPSRICFVGQFVTLQTYNGICPGPTCAPKGTCMAGLQACGGNGQWGSCNGQVLPVNDPAQPETTCDSRDDDCDGSVDDGIADADGDGYRTCQGDCNDSDPAIHPGAPEVCNNKDDDCNGSVDGNSTSCYTGPAGTQGVGRCLSGTATCVAGQASGTCTGQVLPLNPADQDETLCNGIDDDCDGRIDEGFDKDGDGRFSCALCPTYGSSICDCNDNDKFTYPGNREICDCQDNNCVSGADEGNVCLGAPCFDFDDDGYTNCQGDCDDHNTLVNPGRSERVGNGIDDDCNGAVDENVDVDRDGYTTGQNDCNDKIATVHPGAAETCDGFDNNCNGTVDEGFDQDADLVSVCAGDCNDNNANVNPVKVFILGSGAHISENCSNGVDDDCDGKVDQPFTAQGLPQDLDGDGVTLCQGDCNDFNPAVHGAAGAIPVAAEICDGLDNDCDGVIDEGFDADFDFVSTCFGDCNDSNVNVNSHHWEVASNGIDDNCNGQIDEGQTDQDGDGFTPICGDCNDSDPTINPHATELCDRKDNNCDSFIDSAPGNFNLCTTCFDADGDGETNCDGDCNDSDPAIARAAPEICDGKDNDCDGFVDLDSFGLRVCHDDGGNGDGPIDPNQGDGSIDGGDGGDGGPNGTELPPDVLIGCGCSQVTGGGTAAWGLLGVFVAMALGRMRKARKVA